MIGELVRRERLKASVGISTGRNLRSGGITVGVVNGEFGDLKDGDEQQHL